MNCPNCDEILIAVEKNNIEVEYCIKCKGIFLDADEWYLIKNELKLPFLVDDLMNINPCKDNCNEKPKVCPKCNQVMEKVKMGNLVLDRCPNRHGVWFEAGELSEYLNKNAKEKNETVSFLGEILYR